MTTFCLVFVFKNKLNSATRIGKMLLVFCFNFVTLCGSSFMAQIMKTTKQKTYPDQRLYLPMAKSLDSKETKK